MFWRMGEREAGYLHQVMTNLINEEQLAEIDYVSVADPDTLQEIEGQVEQALLSLAVRVGGVRLIDNVVISG